MRRLSCLLAAALLGPAVNTWAAEPEAGAAAYALAQREQGLTGQPINLAQAFSHLQRAAEAGHVRAQTDLAFAYMNGQALAPQDLEKAFHWFQKAAIAGSVPAQCMLGDFHQRGMGGARQDDAEAARWYLKSAGQDDRCAARSQYALFLAYEAGRGVPRDLGTAIAWLRRAAEADNPVAQAALGRAYLRGHGVEPNAEHARRWLRLAREGVSPHEDHVHDSRSFASPGLMERLAPPAPLLR